MKKKLTVATVLILLLAVCLTMLVGCDDMFIKNDERDANQVVASVNYEGQSANIYKFELEASYASYSYIYVNYYGMSSKEAADYILRSLAQQKLLTLYARAKVTELLKLESMPADVKDLLTRSEYDKAIDDANTSLLNSLKSIVETLITDDNYNNGTTDNNTDKDDDDEDIEIDYDKDIVSVRFESNGGSEVARQRMNVGVKAKKPTDPTKDGYTFYGWYDNAKLEGDKYEDGVFTSGEFDFDSAINSNTVLYAKWVEVTSARTEMPEVEEEEEDDYDPDNDDESVEISPMFFSAEYKATIEDEFKDEEFVEKINSKLNKTLADYIDDGLAELSKNIKSNTFKKTDEECYAYYLANQMDTVLVAKMQRLIGNSVEVSDEEIEAEFNAVVNKNKQTFSGSNADSAYSSALTSTLTNTYYHPTMDNDGSYGFVINILLKLDDDSLKTLTDMCQADPSPVGVEKAKIMRNRLISDMKIKVSNPSYKSSEVVKDTDGNEIELRDPMTDPRNPYNNVVDNGSTKKEENHDYQVKTSDGYNDYNAILSFVKNEETGKFEIKYGATEHPAMAYLLEEVPAFDKGEQIGIIHQIHNSFNQVMKYVSDGADNGGLTKEQGVYWLREVATKWLYLVGDDSGAVTDSSNNNGLGYLITPEGKESSYLEDFTDYARKLIKDGTGSFTAGTVDANTFVGVTSSDGTMAGNGVAYVVADSFIGNGTTNFDNAYAGVFVLLNSYTVWDTDKAGEENTLDINYKMTIGKDEDDVKTIYDTIKETILEAKKTAAYNLDVNTMGVKYMESGITYYEKAYKSLWKD